MTSYDQRAATALSILFHDLGDLRIPDTDGYDPDWDERIDKSLCEHCDPHSCDRTHDERDQELRDVKQVVNTAVGVLRIKLARFARDEFGVDLGAEVAS
jgi:hypothetical protein